MHAETVAQPLLEGKLLRARKGLARLLDLRNARRGERADVLPPVVKGEEEPFPIDVREMIRVHHAAVRGRLARLAIGDFKLAARGGGLGERVEDPEVQHRLGGGAEGDGLLDVGKVEGNGVRQRLLHLADGGEQRLLEARAAILLEGLLRHNQRKQLALGDLKSGKRADLLGVEIAVAQLVEINGQPQPVAHELHIAVDGLGRDLQVTRQGHGIGEPAGVQCLVNPLHPLQGRTRQRLLNLLLRHAGSLAHRQPKASGDFLRTPPTGLSRWPTPCFPLRSGRHEISCRRCIFNAGMAV